MHRDPKSSGELRVRLKQGKLRAWQFESAMGPILQERSAASTKKEKVSSKDRAWTRVPGGDGSATSSKKGKTNQTCRPQKKTGSQPKNATQQLCTESCLAMEKDRQYKVKRDTTQVTKASITNHSVSRRCPIMDKRGERNGRPGSRNSKKSDGSQTGQGSTCRVLSLPLCSLSDVHQELLDLGPLRQREQEEVDADSGSDLSDSERLPMPPSPCTPPQLNLRAEVIRHNDLQAHFHGPRSLSQAGHIYPDFLPPPFNTWSLQQLAVFLNTEGKGAPRPKPIGRLEKYLERLLQLEWLQIQTVQEENGKPTAPVSVARPRPHTAPPTSLSSPKCLRQCQRAFPLAFLSSLADPSTGLLSGRACPHCRIRYPFCDGTCRFYAHQRYSRLSPLLERKVRPIAPPKRSSSESRACTSDCVPRPGGPGTGGSYLRRMQAAGNVRKPPGGPKLSGSHLVPCPGAACGGLKSFTTKATGASHLNMKGASPKERDAHEWDRAGCVEKGPRAALTSTTKDNSSSKGSPSTKLGEKLKHVKFVTK